MAESPPMTPVVHTPITPKLIDSLYIEAMTLADEARSYFDRDGAVERSKLDPVARVAFSCESLKVTTRLMHVVSWLLVDRIVGQREIVVRSTVDPLIRVNGIAGATDLGDGRGRDQYLRSVFRRERSERPARVADEHPSPRQRRAVVRCDPGGR